MYTAVVDPHKHTTIILVEEGAWQHVWCHLDVQPSGRLHRSSGGSGCSGSCVSLPLLQAPGQYLELAWPAVNVPLALQV